MAGNAVSARTALFAASLAAIAGSSCIRDFDLVVPEDDAIAIASVVSAGERRVYLLATRPRRPAAVDAPTVEAFLTGPSGKVSFGEPLSPAHCGASLGGFGDWYGPRTCLEAVLPAPVAHGESYRIEGGTRRGRFSGVTVVPEPVEIFEPGDSVELIPYVSQDVYRADIEIAISNPPSVAWMLAQPAGAVQVIVDDDGAVHEQQIGLVIVPQEWSPGRSKVELTMISDPSTHAWRAPAVRLDLVVAGLDENVGRYARHRSENGMLIKPWPSFGLNGDDGIVGYFGSASRSRGVPVTIRPWH